MLVARFNCPKCDTLLTPKVPQPGGKMIRCPKCSGAIEVPLPEIEEVEEVEEVEPATGRTTKQASARRPAVDEEDERPSRRREREEDEEEERPQKRRKKPKKARGGGSGLKVAAIVGAVLLLVVGLGVGGYFLFASKFSMSTNPYAQPYLDVTATLSTVTDQASAKAAEPKLLSLAKQFRQLYEQYTNALKGASSANIDQAVAAAIADAERNPAKNRAMIEQMEREEKEMAAITAKVNAEVRRVNKVPGGKELIDAFYAAWGEGAWMMKVPVNGEELTEKLTQENYDKIKVGMTEQQVVDTLGKFAFTHKKGPGAKTLQYSFGFIEIKDGKVVEKKP